MGVKQTPGVELEAQRASVSCITQEGYHLTVRVSYILTSQGSCFPGLLCCTSGDQMSTPTLLQSVVVFTFPSGCQEVMINFTGQGLRTIFSAECSGGEEESDEDKEKENLSQGKRWVPSDNRKMENLLKQLR